MHYGWLAIGVPTLSGISYSAYNNNKVALKRVEHPFQGNDTNLEWLWILAANFAWPSFLNYPRHSTLGLWPAFHRNRFFSWGFWAHINVSTPPQMMCNSFCVFWDSLIFFVTITPNFRPNLGIFHTVARLLTSSFHFWLFLPFVPGQLGISLGLGEGPFLVEYPGNCPLFLWGSTTPLFVTSCNWLRNGFSSARSQGSCPLLLVDHADDVTFWVYQLILSVLGSFRYNPFTDYFSSFGLHSKISLYLQTSSVPTWEMTSIFQQLCWLLWAPPPPLVRRATVIRGQEALAVLQSASVLNPDLLPVFEACRRVQDSFDNVLEYLHVDFASINLQAYQRALRRFEERASGLPFPCRESPPASDSDSGSTDCNLGCTGPPVGAALQCRVLRPPTARSFCAKFECTGSVLPLVSRLSRPEHLFFTALTAGRPAEDGRLGG